ncbi:hypothetical protein [Ralstonia condita]|uniref:hypothetical protein n=1 Tax=Ralstonia condita TaxID=3058600 RepID=UPI00292FECB5|nr:hypothetical protein [Ralstonia sp. LMG 7141]
MRDTLTSQSEDEAMVLLTGCVERICERAGKPLPGTIDYRAERRNPGLRGGKVIRARRGYSP